MSKIEIVKKDVDYVLDNLRLDTKCSIIEKRTVIALKYWYLYHNYPENRIANESMLYNYAICIRHTR